MISWSVTASFLKHCNVASVRIPLHQFLNDFKVLSSVIEKDALILQFAKHDHFYCDPSYNKIVIRKDDSLMVIK
jgi:hypothetical protein